MPPPEPRTLTLLLVRHGETTWNREGRLQGWRDVPLSPAGRQQAQRLADCLAQTWSVGGDPLSASFIPGPPCAVYASDLSRACDTARAITSAIAPVTGGGLPVELVPALRERNFGDREGLTADEAYAKWGENARLRVTGETYTQVNERMSHVLQRLWDGHAAKTAGENVVLVVGHGGSLRLWLCKAVGLGPNAVHHFHLDNTGLSVITFSGPTFGQSAGRILLCNDTAHLYTRQAV